MTEHASAQRDGDGRMPLVSRVFFTIAAILMPVGSHLADYNETHVFNPRWPPHAKFHTGQTLMLASLLGAMTLVFAWRRTSDQRSAVLAASGFAALYWVSQAGAILYPGTAFADPEFIGSSRALGLPVQLFVELVFLSVVALAAWFALRAPRAPHFKD